MSFLTDLVEGHTSNLGRDITGAFRPNEIVQTLEGLGGLALGATGIGLGLDALGGAGAVLPSFLGGDAGAIGADAAGGLPASLSSSDVAAGAPESIDTFTGADPNMGLVNPTGANSGATPSSGAGGGFWSNLSSSLSPSNLGSAVGRSLTTNPLGAAVAVGGLGLQLARGQQTTANQNQLQAEAATTATQGSILQNYLATGTLPPALQAQINQATTAARARITANYAAQGMDTDPTRNSALAQELNNIDMQAVVSAGQIETQLLQTGLNETGLSSQLYQALVGVDTANNNALMQAIASFSAALSGGRTTINVGGNSAARPISASSGP